MTTQSPPSGRTKLAPGAPGVSACPHCGTAVEGDHATFCCGGCDEAWKIIHGAGLEDYYRRREAVAPRPSGPVGGWSTVPVDTDAEGRCTASVQIDGLRCAACVWVTERVLGSVDGVDSAHVSYASGRARLRWDPDRTDLETLAGRISALGYRPRVLGEGSRWDRGLLLRLGVAAFATMNIMLVSASIYSGWASSMEPRFLALFQWTSLILATPLTLWCAGPFFSGAIQGLRRGVLHMDLPIALGIAVLYGHALVVTVGGFGEAYLDSLGMLVTLLLAGRVLEGHGRRRTAEAALSLAATVPSEARRIDREGGIAFVPSADLRVGDRIAVAAGQEFPADGVVRAGRGQVGTALLTGESRPVAVGPEDEVSAGTLLLDGSLEVEVRRIGVDTTVRRMAERIREAADRPVRPLFADRAAPWFTAATLVAAALTAIGWGIFADPASAIEATVAVLVVACPCALALAHPLIASAGLGAAARRGLLLRSPEVLDRLAEVDEIALDKTGTVTAGEMRVVEAPREALRLAAGLERWGTHPVARAILEAAVREGIPFPAAEAVRETPGVGIEGRVDGRPVRVRSAGPGRVRVEVGPTDGWWGTAIWQGVGEIVLDDPTRTDTDRVAADFEALALPVTLLSGDDPRRVAEAAARIGAARWRGGLDPDQKAEYLGRAAEAGARVLFAGDGINDGPALVRAHVGVAMGSGAASSVLAADGVVASESLGAIVRGVRIARLTRDAVRRTQERSILYNVVAVGAAAAGLVNPLVAAILMPLSSGFVIAAAAAIERRADR